MIDFSIYNPPGVGNHVHGSTMVERGNEIVLVWYSYKTEEHIDGSLSLNTLDITRNKWNNPRKILDDFSSRSLGNPVLFLDQEKQVHLFFVRLEGTYWDSAQIFKTTLLENTWSPPQKVNTPQGMMIRHSPVSFGKRSFLIPAYDEKTKTTIIFESEFPFTQWNEVSRIGDGLIQGDLLQVDKNQFQIYLRATDDPRFVFRAVSYDNAKTWEEPQKTNLYCPLSGIAALKSRSGKIIVSNNHTEQHKRNPINIALSNNLGENFNIINEIDTTGNEMSYPCLLQTSNGQIHISYTFNRKMIKHAIYDEHELLC
ncbi:MAG: exo-alpha-sialidase [Halobacteriovoraceae bacterium]|nr:exo-alpha-sialidase [Halobacteriovoraceae bacterium]